MKTQATLSQPSAVPGSPLLQVSGALFGIIAFILIAAWLAKRFGLAGKTAGARGLKVSASTTLGPRERDATSSEQSDPVAAPPAHRGRAPECRGLQQPLIATRFRRMGQRERLGRKGVDGVRRLA